MLYEVITKRFSQNNLDVILLKGAAALADDLYGDLGARLMSDVDLLVSRAHQEQVENALLELGFEVGQADQENIFFEGHHHLPPYCHLRITSYNVCYTKLLRNILNCYWS